MKKIGIMGGTFDPIHVGHLLLAENAYDTFGLDSVWVMPSGNPPHKSDHPITQQHHRCRMTQLAIADNPHLEYSDYECKKDGFSYTAQTMNRLKKEYPDYKFYFIVGGDSLFEIEKWFEPETILENAVLVAAGRNDIDSDKLEEKIRELREHYLCDIRILPVPGIDISSTDLRNRVKEGKSIRYFVCSDVEKYIYQNKLYVVQK